MFPENRIHVFNSVGRGIPLTLLRLDILGFSTEFKSGECCATASDRDLGFSGDSRDCFPEALGLRLRLRPRKSACLFAHKVFVIQAGETPLSGFRVGFHPLNGFLGVFAWILHQSSRWSGRANSDTALKIRTIATGKTRKDLSRSNFLIGIKQRLRRLAEHLSSLNQRAG